MPKSATKKPVAKTKPATKLAKKSDKKSVKVPAAKLAKSSAVKPNRETVSKKVIAKADSKSHSSSIGKKSAATNEKSSPAAESKATAKIAGKVTGKTTEVNPASKAPAVAKPGVSKAIVAEVKSPVKGQAKTKAAPSQEHVKAKAGGTAIAAVAKDKAAKPAAGATSPAEGAALEKPAKSKSQILSKSALKKLEAKIRTEADVMKRWQSVFDQYAKVKPTQYSMSGTFEPSQAIEHKVLGWGLILECRENRIQVLFKDGIRTLIMNYRP